MTELRHYKPVDTVTFCKSRDPYGELGNMAGGYPIVLRSADVTFKSSEALYQALKYPDLPQVQQLILDAPNGYVAKRVQLEYQDMIHPKFHEHKVAIMGFAISMKALQHEAHFKQLLQDVNGRAIVEYAKHDSFWGASTDDQGLYTGTNALGRLWMQIADDFKHGRPLWGWQAVKELDFLKVLDVPVDLNVDARVG